MKGYYSDKDLQTIHNAYYKKFTNGNYGYLIWSLFNQIAEYNVVEKDYQSLSQLYYEMALFKGENEKHTFIMNQLSKKYELLHYKESEIVTGVKISACDNACEVCKSYNGKKYALEQAIKFEPIPHKNCKNFYFGKYSLCRCEYIALTDY